jgi:SAM-dependent methyltransferase
MDSLRNVNDNVKITSPINRFYPLKKQIEQLNSLNDIYLTMSKSKIEAMGENLTDNDFYYNAKSRRQIKNVVDLYKNNDITALARLVLLIQGVCKIKNIEKIIKMVLTGNDGEIYKKIRDIPIKNRTFYKKKIVSIPLEIFTKIQKYIHINDFNIGNYLDIGCGSCLKTGQLGKYLKLEKKNIFGSDFENQWHSYKKKLNDITFVPLDVNEKMDFKNDQIDLITCIHSLHHMTDIKFKLGEIHRILKNKGLFVIVEHDVLFPIDHMLADIEHLLFEEVLNKNISYYKTHNTTYYNYIEMDLMLKEFGFTLFGYSHYNRGYSHEFVTPTLSYIAIYVNNKQYD